MSNCPKCGAKMIELRSQDLKICSGNQKECGHEEHWPLKPGDKYMHKNDVEPFIRYTPEEVEQKEAEIRLEGERKGQHQHDKPGQ